MLLPLPRSVYRHSVDLVKRTIFDGVTMTEFPKSGGTWVGEMLSAATGMPFIRDCAPPSRKYVMHKHALPGLIAGKRPIVIFRDGRDALVSFYFHARFLKDPRTVRLTTLFADKFPDSGAGARAEMPRFVERMLTDPIYPRFTWHAFAEAWHERPNTIATSYEEMHRDPVSTMKHLLERLGLHPVSDLESIVEQFSFARQSGQRMTGEEDRSSFLRKGIVSDWRNYFCRETAEMFDHHAGAALIALGYESDRNWISSVAP